MDNSSPIEIEAARGLLMDKPYLWDVRIALIEQLVRSGKIELAKEIIREAPDGLPVPEVIQNRIHSLLAEKPPAISINSEVTTMLPAAPKSTNREKLNAIVWATIVHLLIVISLLLITTKRNQPNESQLVLTPSREVKKPTLQSGEKIAQSQMANWTPVSNFAMTISSHSLTSFQGTDVFSTVNDASFPSSFSDVTGQGKNSRAMPKADITNIEMIPESMWSRCSFEDRMARLEAAGADIRFEKAVVKGLNYITTRQKESGAFGQQYQVAMTGFAILCYLGHCETPESFEYGDNVAKAALYLMNRSMKDHGFMATKMGGIGEAYEHAIATYALAELHAMTKASGKPIPRLEMVLQKAVHHIIIKQAKTGGWAYRRADLISIENNEDLSVSGWCIQALKAARLAGIQTKGLDRSFHLAMEKYLPAAQDLNGAFKYLAGKSEGKESTTGIGLLAMYLGGWEGSYGYERALKVLIASNRNVNPSGDYYAPYYNTQVYFFHGGPEWYRFNNSFLSELLEHQKLDGSWSAGGGRYGGPDTQFMRTTLAILMLEVPYRYLPSNKSISEFDF